MAEEPNVAAGPMTALLEAAKLFRMYEAHHRDECRRLIGQINFPAGRPLQPHEAEELQARAADRDQKASRNRAAAEMCERAVAEIERMAELKMALEQRPKPQGPDVFAAFVEGFQAGFDAATWDEWKEVDRPWPEDKPEPAHTLDTALAMFRARVAKGVAGV